VFETKSTGNVSLQTTLWSVRALAVVGAGQKHDGAVDKEQEHVKLLSASMKRCSASLKRFKVSLQVGVAFEDGV